LFLIVKDLHANAQFAVNDNSGRGFNQTNEIINENNYRNYFHTTDLDQGILGFYFSCYINVVT